MSIETVLRLLAVPAERLEALRAELTEILEAIEAYDQETDLPIKEPVDKGLSGITKAYHSETLISGKILPKEKGETFTFGKEKKKLGRPAKKRRGRPPKQKTKADDIETRAVIAPTESLRATGKELVCKACSGLLSEQYSVATPAGELYHEKCYRKTGNPIREHE